MLRQQHQSRGLQWVGARAIWAEVVDGSVLKKEMGDGEGLSPRYLPP